MYQWSPNRWWYCAVHKLLYCLHNLLKYHNPSSAEMLPMPNIHTGLSNQLHLNMCCNYTTHEREKKDEDKWKLNDYWLGFLIIKIYINANKKKLHNAINKETTVENKFITYYNRDVTDHCWMVFVCQTLNYRERYHPELAFVLDDISPRLPPFPSAFLTFCQISRLHE